MSLASKAFALMIILLFSLPSVQLLLTKPAYAGMFAGSSLVVEVVPPTLPADNKTYAAVIVSLRDSSGQPSIATNETRVFLTSSQENVGRIVSSITIRPGQVYAIANFTTTTTAGDTAITASSVGLQPASASVKTATPSGFPSHLKVLPVPETQLARRSGFGALMIEMLDDIGLPAKAVKDTTVSLFSSNRQLLNLSSTTITIREGSILNLSAYVTGFVTGSASITAFSPGFNSGSASVAIVGTAPLALVLSPQPDTIATSTTGRLVVTLTDFSGKPATAPYDVQVAIRSSNLTAATVDGSVTIQKGQIYAVASYRSGTKPGKATITASSPGLLSDFRSVRSLPVASRGPTQLNMYVAPNPILADRRAYNAIVIALVNASGFPAVAPAGGISVTLTSSNSLIGKLSNSVTIPSGMEYARVAVNSTFFVGSTSLTASAQNLLPAVSQLSASGPIPARVVVAASPRVLPAETGSYPSLVLMLQDSSGFPAVAPVDIVVHLSSSNTNIVSFNSSVFIPAGRTFTLTTVNIGVSPGTTNITASASGYSSSSTLLQTAVPAPFRVAVYVSPSSTLLSKSQNDAVLAVQLQDADGNPARARVPTDVTVVSSNESLIGVPLVLRIPTRGDHTTSILSSLGPGSSLLTAFAPGLSSSNTKLSVQLIPVSLQVTSAAQVIWTNQTTTVSVKVLLFGKPLEGATVKWLAAGGSLTPQTSSTDASGSSSAKFTPAAQGSMQVTAVVSDGAIATLNRSTTIVTLQPPVKVQPTLTQRLLSFPFNVILVVGVVAGVFVTMMVFVRRRGRSDESGELGLETNSFLLRQV